MTVALPVATGDAVLQLLPQLQAALAGTGPGVVPFAEGSTVPTLPTQDVALVVQTSGSTGAAKQVLLSAAALRHSAMAGQRRLHDGDPGTWLLALPAQHIAGMNVLIRAAVAERSPVVLDIAQTFTTTSFAAATDRLPTGPAFVSLVPTQLHRLMAEPAGIEALRRFTAVLVGGAATAPELVGRARTAGVAMVTSYGMSETCGGCVYDGRPLDGVTVTLDAASRITLSGPVVADGYAGRPFEAPFHQEPGGRSFTTGDLGVLVDGALTVLGRADDMLISGGVNVAPQAVEHVLAAAPGVAQVALTGVPDPEWGQLLVAVVVADQGEPPSLETLRSLVSTALGAAAAPKRLVLTDALPTRGPGKLDRTAVAALARAALARD